MKILYHHRTRSTDAQRIHIQEIVRAFEELGHEVKLASLVPIDAGQHDAGRDAADPWWKKLVRRLPFAYEMVQLAYNAVGVPLLLKAAAGGKTAFIYERYSLFNFTGVLVARMLRVPIVLEVNSPFALEQSRDREIRLRSFAEWTERAICNMADHVIVVSTPLARIMAEAGVKPSLIEVMPNGVSPRHFRGGEASEELRRGLGLEGALVVGFVGWFRKWHGLEMLLEAFDESGLAAAGVKILLIGDGPAMADLKSIVAARGMGAGVVFSGPVPHAEVPRYLDLVDIAVQPAANEYCCPMKILEYMALGKPVVAPRQENIVELLKEGEEAVFFTPGNAASLAGALRDLAGDRERAARMGQNARAAVLARGRLWTNNAQRVVEMVGRGGKPRPE